MTAPDWQKLKRDAADTIQGIDVNKMNKDAYVLYGASLAILDHEERGGVNMSTTQENSTQANVAHPHNSKTLREIVDDELSDAEMYAGMSEYEIARDELRHADRFLAVLKAQPDKHSVNELIERRNAIAAKL